MGVWDRIREPFRRLVKAASPIFRGNPARREAAMFSAAIVALAAKMAKADGIVTEDEVAVFRRLCQVPPGQEDRVWRLFDMAKRSVFGFDGYARQIAAAYQERADMLARVLDALFAIAAADGFVHENELLYLETVAEIFGLDETTFPWLEAKPLRASGFSPYAVLDIAPSAGDDEIRRRYRKLVLDHHPDRLPPTLPPEERERANERLAAVNAAYAAIRRERGL